MTVGAGCGTWSANVVRLFCISVHRLVKLFSEIEMNTPHRGISSDSFLQASLNCKGPHHVRSLGCECIFRYDQRPIRHV